MKVNIIKKRLKQRTCYQEPLQFNEGESRREIFNFLYKKITSGDFDFKLQHERLKKPTRIKSWRDRGFFLNNKK